MNKINLHIGLEYVPDWKTWEGLREFWQNMYDACILRSKDGDPSNLFFDLQDLERGNVLIKSVHESEGDYEVGSLSYDKKSKVLYFRNSIANESNKMTRKSLILGGRKMKKKKITQTNIW